MKAKVVVIRTYLPWAMSKAGLNRFTVLLARPGESWDDMFDLFGCCLVKALLRHDNRRGSRLRFGGANSESTVGNLDPVRSRQNESRHYRSGGEWRAS